MRYDKENKKITSLKQKISILEKNNHELTKDAESIKEVLNNTLHEIRRFSALLSKFTERLSRDTEDNQNLNQIALSAFYTAGMISSRLAYTDIELNPSALENQTTVTSGIYKKFDKARRILAEQAKDRSVSIELVGESRAEINALPVFELLPFVILENGIKYSPHHQSVEVHFEQIIGKQVVTVKSTGPTVAPHEVPKLLDKGFRGARTKTMPGEGLGLFLAKRVCEYHCVNIRIENETVTTYQLNGIDYSEFRVVLEF